jgi:gliding motility-associatede transport system auxiliary component
MSKKLLSIYGLATALIFLLAVNILSNSLLKGIKLDLTEAKLYTLSEGTNNIVSKLEEPITLRFFYSEKLAADTPGISDYARRVRELLGEYAAKSNGKITLEVIDPEPFSEEEELAVNSEMQGVPISQSERLYFGLQGVNSIDGKKVIPFFDPSNESFLQYDISKLVYDLAHPTQRKVTIITDLPVAGSNNPMARYTGETVEEPWMIYDQLDELYDVNVVGTAKTSFDRKTDILFIIHPKNLTPELKYQIDQYVLKGGKTMVFVDPLAEAEKIPTDPNNPMASLNKPKNSNLPELFKAWGIEVVDGMVVGDRERAQQVMVGSQNNPTLTSYVLYASLVDDDLNRDEMILSNLENINIASAGMIRPLEGAETTVTPLVQTSADTQAIPVSQAQMFPDPKKMLQNFQSQDKKEMVVARVTGNAKTIFPDGLDENKAADHVDASTEPISVTVFSDVDMLSDRTWVQVQRVFNMKIPRLMASNGNLVINAVDLYSGSDDLISIRGRGQSQRPFDVVIAMEKKAQEDSVEKVRELEENLKKTEQRLQDLQREAPDGQGMMIASSDLRQEIEKFEKEQRQTQITLRRLEHNKRQDIETLGKKLKFINIGLLPLLVGIAAVGIGMFRISRRRRRW